MLTLTLSSFLRAPTLTPNYLGPRKRGRCSTSKPGTVVHPLELPLGIDLTSCSKIHLDFSFCPNVFGVELDLGVFLLITGGHQDWIAQVIIVEVEGRLVVPAAVAEHLRSNRGSCILDDDLVVRHRTAVCSTDMAFNGKPVVHLMHRHRRGRKIHTPTEPGSSKAKHCPPSGGSCYAPGSVPHVPRRLCHRLCVVFSRLLRGVLLCKSLNNCCLLESCSA